MSYPKFQLSGDCGHHQPLASMTFGTLRNSKGKGFRVQELFILLRIVENSAPLLSKESACRTIIGKASRPHQTHLMPAGTFRCKQWFLPLELDVQHSSNIGASVYVRERLISFGGAPEDPGDHQMGLMSPAGLLFIVQEANVFGIIYNQLIDVTLNANEVKEYGVLWHKLVHHSVLLGTEEVDGGHGRRKLRRDVIIMFNLPYNTEEYRSISIKSNIGVTRDLFNQFDLSRIGLGKSGWNADLVLLDGNWVDCDF
ncbi:hypothetical protein DFH06DRAFT_1150761 [Mycena polygramma]|nr:hypothetical protein DFH06DRAFT_1150761 [Mycena polygramma]